MEHHAMVSVIHVSIGTMVIPSLEDVHGNTDSWQHKPKILSSQKEIPFGSFATHDCKSIGERREVMTSFAFSCNYEATELLNGELNCGKRDR